MYITCSYIKNSFTKDSLKHSCLQSLTAYVWSWQKCNLLLTTNISQQRRSQGVASYIWPGPHQSQPRQTYEWSKTFKNANFLGMHTLVEVATWTHTIHTFMFPHLPKATPILQPCLRPCSSESRSQHHLSPQQFSPAVKLRENCCRDKWDWERDYNTTGVLQGNSEQYTDHLNATCNG